jgi:hypothetical protein
MTLLAEDAGGTTRRRAIRKARVYVLVDVAGGHHDEVARALRRKPGVVMADVVEAKPSVIMVIEARDRQKLAELTVRALAAIELETDGMHLMPAEEHGSMRCGVARDSTL